MLYFFIAHDIATFFLIHKILLNRSYIPFFNGACLSRISINAAWKSSHFSISDQQFWFWFLKNKTFMWVIRTTQRDFLFMKIEFNSKSFKVLWQHLIIFVGMPSFTKGRMLPVQEFLSYLNGRAYLERKNLVSFLIPSVCFCYSLSYPITFQICSYYNLINVR